MARICVYCGSMSGTRPEYVQGAQALALALVQGGHSLVYGGGNVGLMGVVADAVLAAGGAAVGVIPHALLAREVGHPGVTTLHVVDSMHERKALMAELSDAFIALPGGVGTFEELFEAVTWTQLGVHRKPCGLLNVAGFYDGLLTFLDHAWSEGFLRAETRGIVTSSTDPTELISRLLGMAIPSQPQWITRQQT